MWDWICSLLAIVAVAAVPAGYVLWSRRRRMNQAVEDAARKSSGGKGEE